MKLHGKPTKNGKFKRKVIDTSKYKKPNDDNSSSDKDRAAIMMIAVTMDEIEMLLSTTTGPSALAKNTFIADSGATCHMKTSTQVMYDLEDHIQAVTVGNSEQMFRKYKGKFKGTVIQQDGQFIDIILDDVLFIPDLWVNLFSIIKILSNSAVNLKNEVQLFQLYCEDPKYILTFDKIFTAGSGHLQGVEIRSAEEYATKVMLTGALTIYEDLHEKLGHPNPQIVKQTAKHYGIEAKEWDPTKCAHCATSKHKRSPIPKKASFKDLEKGEKINLDITYIQTISFGGAKYWLLLQDKKTDHIWSFFLKEKSETADVVIKWLKMIHKEMDLKVKTIRCDNSGENRKVHEFSQIV